MQHLSNDVNVIFSQRLRSPLRLAGAVLCAIAMSACASGRATQPSTTLGGGSAGTTMITNPDATSGVSLNMANLAISAKTEVPLGINEAWSRLNAAYAALGIKLTNRDENAHVIGNMSFKARRKVGDIELRKALECGGSSQGTPNSETYDITMGVRSQLVALTQDKVQLETFVDGVARNPMTNNMNVVKCVTLGMFEKQIAEMVRTGVVPVVKK